MVWLRDRLPGEDGGACLGTGPRFPAPGPAEVGTGPGGLQDTAEEGPSCPWRKGLCPRPRRHTGCTPDQIPALPCLLLSGR